MMRNKKIKAGKHHLHVVEFLMAWQECYLNSYSTLCAINAFHVQVMVNQLLDAHTFAISANGTMDIP